MIPITNVIPAGAWRGHAADMVMLDYDGRRRRRAVMTGASGSQYLLDLAETAHLRDGDGLILAGGGVVQVVARAEPLMEVRAETPAALAQLAWHLGNRHLPAQFMGDRILIRRDHVIGHMLVHLGAEVAEIEAAFDPERGAYHDHAH